MTQPIDESLISSVENGEAVELKEEPNGNLIKVDHHPSEDYSTGSNRSERDSWSNRLDFLFSIIGFAVDLANVWRFPHLCYRNGGGAFLIPYFLMLIFGAIPLFYMELILGQYHRQGAISVWKIAPLFKGIGWSTVLICWLVAFYYNVVIAWSLFYLVRSFTTKLPWGTCGNWWNSEDCFDVNDLSGNSTLNYTTGILPAAEYFENAVLGLNQSPNGIADIGAPKWDITLCAFAVFTILFSALCKGIKVSGKVIWVTAIAPYMVLAVLLVRGLFLEGASVGIIKYVTPRMEKLLDPYVWRDAAFQIFFSVGAGFGVHLAYASYNPFHNNCYKDCLITAAANSFTSIFSGFVVFVYLGYMSVKMNAPFEKVATEGPGLVFVVYPEAIASLPAAPIWSIIFFLMLLTLGLDSAMGGLESVITGILDNFRGTLRRFHYKREMVTACVCGSAFLCSLASTTYGGAYVVHMLDHFAAGFSLLFTVFAECVVVSWIYGLTQFKSDIRDMLLFTPGIFWRICWKFISPCFLLIIIISTVIISKPLIFESYAHGEYEYPTWSQGLGWLIALLAPSMIPIYAVFKCFKLKGSLKQRIALGITPTTESKLVTQKGEISRFRAAHWLEI